MGITSRSSDRARRWAGVLALVGALACAAPAFGQASRPAASAPTSAPAFQDERAKADLRRAVLANLPSLASAKTDWQRAVLLRDHVHSITTVDRGMPNPPISAKTYRDVVAGKQKMFCGGMAMLYSACLEAVGMKTRMVYLAADSVFPDPKTRKSSPGDTHVTVEVLIRKRWILQDPTFNVHWSVEGEAMGVMAMRRAYHLDMRPRSQTDGKKTMPGRSLQEYYLPFRKLLANVEISTIELLSPERRGRRTPVAFAPPPQPWRQRLLLATASKAQPVKGLIRGPALRIWASPQDLRAKWARNEGAKLEIVRDLAVLTTAATRNYQLWCDVGSVDAGSYEFTVIGTVRSGLGQMAVLAVKDDTWLARRHFSPSAEPSAKVAMTVRFDLDRPRAVKLVISNYSLDGLASKWDIHSVGIWKLPDVPPAERAKSK